ncbi:MAG TPA: TGS domain-containing protein, partial [Pyrinomonadaceae bacterium]
MAQDIQVTLPDGSKKEVPSGTTPLDIARSISPRLADAALVAKIKPSANSSRQSAPDQNGAAGQQAGSDAEKTPASMHAPVSKDGWEFADLSKPLEQDVCLRLLT